MPRRESAIISSSPPSEGSHGNCHGVQCIVRQRQRDHERTPMFRVGFGQDSHRFSADRTRSLVLAGVHVPGEPGLAGNSDADVILHALCRALEQALGTDAFSQYADEMAGRGIVDSREYVKIARARVEAAGYRVNNVGITIEARTPKIEPLQQTFKASLAALLGVPADAIGINASTGEQMTPFGKGEGIQALAIVSLVSQA
jgi:2-C-methyl-D-erythritol 2,4-cyclodiphosphate synthase